MCRRCDERDRDACHAVVGVLGCRRFSNEQLDSLFKRFDQSLAQSKADMPMILQLAKRLVLSDNKVCTSALYTFLALQSSFDLAERLNRFLLSRGTRVQNLILVTEIEIQFVFLDESRKLLRIQQYDLAVHVVI